MIMKIMTMMVAVVRWDSTPQYVMDTSIGVIAAFVMTCLTLTMMIMMMMLILIIVMITVVRVNAIIVETHWMLLQLAFNGQSISPNCPLLLKFLNSQKLCYKVFLELRKRDVGHWPRDQQGASRKLKLADQRECVYFTKTRGRLSLGCKKLESLERCTKPL